MRRAILILIGICLLITVVSADTISASRGVTLLGPTGMMVPLGIENVMPIEKAYAWYNMISAAIILLVSSLASKRNYHFLAILVPVTAAFVTWFGWLYTNNTTMTWSLIIAFGFLGAAIYMKSTLKENFGLGGPGSTLMNITVFMIILSAVLGAVNTAGIWSDSSGVPSEQFTNVNLQEEVNNISNSGGWLDSVINGGTAMLEAAITSVRIIVTMLLSIGFFSAALIAMFPFLTSSPIAIAFLAIFQTAIWIIYAKAFADLLYFKNVWGLEY